MICLIMSLELKIRAPFYRRVDLICEQVDFRLSYSLSISTAVPKSAEAISTACFLSIIPIVMDFNKEFLKLEFMSYCLYTLHCYCLLPSEGERYPSVLLCLSIIVVHLDLQTRYSH